MVRYDDDGVAAVVVVAVADVGVVVAGVAAAAVVVGVVVDDDGDDDDAAAVAGAAADEDVEDDLPQANGRVVEQAAAVVTELAADLLSIRPPDLCRYLHCRVTFAGHRRPNDFGCWPKDR